MGGRYVAAAIMALILVAMALLAVITLQSPEASTVLTEVDEVVAEQAPPGGAVPPGSHPIASKVSSFGAWMTGHVAEAKIDAQDDAKAERLSEAAMEARERAVQEKKDQKEAWVKQKKKTKPELTKESRMKAPVERKAKAARKAAGASLLAKKKEKQAKAKVRAAELRLKKEGRWFHSYTWAQEKMRKKDHAAQLAKEKGAKERHAKCLKMKAGNKEREKKQMTSHGFRFSPMGGTAAVADGGKLNC